MKTLPFLLPAAIMSLLLSITGCQSPAPKTEVETPAPTRLASIAVAAPDGAVIVLVDRSTWIVAPDDRIVAQRWRTADLVEATSNAGNSAAEFPAVLTNQESGSAIHAKQGADFEG
ncbi:MAG: hypothetical protein KDN22_32280 [Verrucomicrobiae bacterium]|nr:hypothetical protein [Verrucomicrobiae bacterium]